MGQKVYMSTSRMPDSCGDDSKAIAVIYPALLRQLALSRALMNSAGARLIICTNPQFDTFFRFSAPRSDLSVITYDYPRNRRRLINQGLLDRYTVSGGVLVYGVL